MLRAALFVLLLSRQIAASPAALTTSAATSLAHADGFSRPSVAPSPGQLRKRQQSQSTSSSGSVSSTSISTTTTTIDTSFLHPTSNLYASMPWSQLTSAFNQLSIAIVEVTPSMPVPCSPSCSYVVERYLQAVPLSVTTISIDVSQDSTAAGTPSLTYPPSLITRYTTVMTGTQAHTDMPAACHGSDLSWSFSMQNSITVTWIPPLCSAGTVTDWGRLTGVDPIGNGMQGQCRDTIGASQPSSAPSALPMVRTTPVVTCDIMLLSRSPWTESYTPPTPSTFVQGFAWLITHAYTYTMYTESRCSGTATLTTVVSPPNYSGGENYKDFTDPLIFTPDEFGPDGHPFASISWSDDANAQIQISTDFEISVSNFSGQPALLSAEPVYLEQCWRLPDRSTFSYFGIQFFPSFADQEYIQSDLSASPFPWYSSAVPTTVTDVPTSQLSASPSYVVTVWDQTDCQGTAQVTTFPAAPHSAWSQQEQVYTSGGEAFLNAGLLDAFMSGWPVRSVQFPVDEMSVAMQISSHVIDKAQLKLQLGVMPVATAAPARGSCFNSPSASDTGAYYIYWQFFPAWVSQSYIDTVRLRNKQPVDPGLKNTHWR